MFSPDKFTIKSDTPNSGRKKSCEGQVTAMTSSSLCENPSAIKDEEGCLVPLMQSSAPASQISLENSAIDSSFGM